jgi:hypothetical protein
MGLQIIATVMLVGIWLAVAGQYARRSSRKRSAVFILIVVVAAICLALWGFLFSANGTDSTVTERNSTGRNGIAPDGTKTERNATGKNRIERPATMRDEMGQVATVPNVPVPIRYSGKRQQEFACRWEHVQREIGPPPNCDAVPVEGYTANGVSYPARWRTTPDDTTANNFKVSKPK